MRRRNDGVIGMRITLVRAGRYETDNNKRNQGDDPTGNRMPPSSDHRAMGADKAGQCKRFFHTERLPKLRHNDETAASL
jgi:hypothetical protein